MKYSRIDRGHKMMVDNILGWTWLDWDEEEEKHSFPGRRGESGTPPEGQEITL